MLRNWCDLHQRSLLTVFWLAVLATAWLRFSLISQDRTFMYDEWNFVMNRWQWSVDSFFSPHNSHFSIIPTTVFFVLFRFIGLDNYGMYQAAGYLVHFGVTTLLLVLLLPRVGRIAALCISISLLFLGTGAENILWPFQIGSMGSVAGYLIALIALDKDERRSPTLLALGLLLSLGSAGFGVVAVAAVAIEVTLRGQWKRYLWSFGLPTASWFVWYFVWGTSEMKRSNITRVIPYVHESLAGALAGVIRAPLALGFLSGWTLVVILLFRLVRARARQPRILGLTSALLLFWILTAMSRAQYWAPVSGRYIYVAVPFLLLLLVELARGLQPQTLAAVALTFAMWSVSSTWDAMNAHGRWLREWGETVSGELWAMEVLLDTTPDGYRPDPTRAPDVAAGPYRRAVTALESSPAVDPSQISEMSITTRSEVDRVLFELGAIVQASREGNFVCITEEFAGRELSLESKVQLIWTTSDVAEIALRAFGDEPVSSSIMQVSAGRALEITVDSRIPANQWKLVNLTSNTTLCLAK